MGEKRVQAYYEAQRMFLSVSGTFYVFGLDGAAMVHRSHGSRDPIGPYR